MTFQNMIIAPTVYVYEVEKTVIFTLFSGFT